MKQFRNLLYFIVGLLLAVNFTLAHANYAPTITYVYNGTGCTNKPSAAACCEATRAYNGAAWVVADYTETSCHITLAPSYSQTLAITRYVFSTTCPNGGTLTGGVCVHTCPAGQFETTSGACVAACPAGETQNPDGSCVSACLAKANQPPSYMWHTNLKGVDMSGQRCSDGCMVTVALDTSTTDYYYTATTITMRMSTSFTGQSCTVGESTPAPDPVPPAQPPTPPKKPVCAATEGVLTSSSGTVACVPPGTPSAEVPKVSVKKTTETFDDGSKKITTETTTQAPSTGATDINKSVQTTPNSSGTAGTAGIPGTTGSGTSSVSDSNGDGQGDGGGDCDPQKDFCGGPGTSGLYEKKSKTVASVVGDFKTGIMSSGIGSASTGFFTVSTPGGSCPTWVVDVAFLQTTLNLSQYFCTATAISMMQLVGSVLMFVAAFVGFRWAIL